MGDADEAEEADFVSIVAEVFADEEVAAECRDPLFNLDVEPNKVVGLEQLQACQLFVDFLGEGLDRQSRHVCFDDAQEAVQSFGLDPQYDFIIQLFVPIHAHHVCPELVPYFLEH